MDDAREIRQDDAISRQAAIDACDQSINLFEAVDRIKELPPVNPQKSTEEATKEFKELLESGYYESQKSEVDS